MVGDRLEFGAFDLELICTLCLGIFEVSGQRLRTSLQLDHYQAVGLQTGNREADP